MDRELPREPEDLGRLLLERLNAADVDGLVELYEPDAVLALPGGRIANGHREIRAVYEDIVVGNPQFEPGEVRKVLRSGDVALTGARLVDGTVTAEVARRQPDGTWRWALDDPDLLGKSRQRLERDPRGRSVLRAAERRPALIDSATSSSRSSATP